MSRSPGAIDLLEEAGAILADGRGGNREECEAGPARKADGKPGFDHFTVTNLL